MSTSQQQAERVEALFRELREEHPEFDRRAYLFVLAALDRLVSSLDERRHLHASELADAVRDLARERYGPLAGSVLRHWGVRTTDDLGAVVYALVDRGVMQARAEDSIEDFEGLCGFGEAFDESYELGGDLRRSTSGRTP